MFEDEVYPDSLAVEDSQRCLVSGTQALKLSPKPTKKGATAGTSSLPPCRVCNAVASGYHYGANTCEACKVFYRRSIANEAAIKPCQAKGKCAENPDGKKMSCADCRYKKCLLIGMTKEGCKKGRYTYEKRTQDTKEMQLKKADEVQTRNFELEHCEETVAVLVQQFRKSFSSMRTLWDDKAQIDHRVKELVTQEQLGKGELLTRLLYSPGHSPSSEIEKWFATLREHQIHASCNPYESSISTSSAEEMIHMEWGNQGENTFHALTNFAKALPGFSDLLLDDRIILLKEGKTDYLKLIKNRTLFVDIEATIYFYEESGDLILVPLVYMRKVFGDEFTTMVLQSGRRLQRLNLTTEDVVVLLALVILTPDRDGLQQSELVSKLQDKMLTTLQYTLKKNHPKRPNILPDTLLLLPLFRESVIPKHCPKLACKEAHPLSYEMMH